MITERIKVLLFFLLFTIIGSLILLWPAFLNQYPLVYNDTGAYLNNSFPVDRAFGYHWFIVFTSLVHHSLWTVVFAQGLLTSFLIFRITSLLYSGLKRRTVYSWITFLFVVLTTGISKYASWVMPDLFTAWLFLGGLLFILSPRWHDRLIASIVVSMSILSHYSHGFLAIISAVLLLFLGCIFRKEIKALWKSFQLLALLVALNVVSLCFINLANGGGFFLTYQGSANFLLARLADSHILYRTLNIYCSEKQWRLCRYKEEFKQPLYSSFLLWEKDSPLLKAENWKDQSEQREIISYAVRCCPRDILKQGFSQSFDLFFRFKASDGIGKFADPATANAIQRFYPKEFELYSKSKQVQGISVKGAVFSANDRETQYIIFVCMLLILAKAAMMRRYDIVTLLVTVIIFVSLNALIVGSSAGVADRLQGRAEWLIPYVFFVSLVAISCCGKTSEGAQKRLFS